jgi:hypothetical protein
MQTIEERIAEYCTIPLPEKRFCESDGCKTALARANKESLCFRHARIEAEQKLQATCAKYDLSLRTQKLRAVPDIKPATPKKLCCVMGCYTEITATSRNRSGRCVEHNHLKCGTQMKDGSIPRPHTPFSQRVAETIAKQRTCTTEVAA